MPRQNDDHVNQIELSHKEITDKIGAVQLEQELECGTITRTLKAGTKPEMKIYVYKYTYGSAIKTSGSSKTNRKTTEAEGDEDRHHSTDHTAHSAIDRVRSGRRAVYLSRGAPSTYLGVRSLIVTLIYLAPSPTGRVKKVRRGLCSCHQAGPGQHGAWEREWRPRATTRPEGKNESRAREGCRK